MDVLYAAYSRTCRSNGVRGSGRGAPIVEKRGALNAGM